MKENLLKKLEGIKPLVTNSPLLKITVKYLGKMKNIYVKCEWYSLTGSIKDRACYQIFYDAIISGKLNSDSKIVEVTSGNMGISITALANLLNLPVTILLPKTMSEERKKLLKLYGANLVEVDDFLSAFNLCKEYEEKGYFCTHQFENESNYYAHYNLTGKEIFDKICDKNVTNFISGVGTSGTLIGTGRYLKENLGIKVVGIEPKNARILTNVKPFKKHKLQGLADQIVPKLYDKNLVDNIIQIGDEDAIKMAQKLCSNLSLGVGISSGANFLGAVLESGDSVTIFPDDNKKYLTTDLIKSTSSSIVDNIELLSVNVVN